MKGRILTGPNHAELFASVSRGDDPHATLSSSARETDEVTEQVTSDTITREKNM